jgi:predicted NUDIX family NTP pyrophosphohydrolase
VATPRQSAGLLLFRREPLEVLLAHMGGPFWARRDEGAWTVPKGELEPGEEALPAAMREFEEEMGRPAPAGEPLALGTVRQAAGKLVTAFALEGDFDPAAIRSNTFTTEWPPRSGRMATFAEVDRAAWLDLDDAKARIVKGQVPLLDRLAELLSP